MSIFAKRRGHGSKVTQNLGAVIDEYYLIWVVNIELDNKKCCTWSKDVDGGRFKDSPEWQGPPGDMPSGWHGPGESPDICGGGVAVVDIGPQLVEAVITLVILLPIKFILIFPKYFCTLPFPRIFKHFKIAQLSFCFQCKYLFLWWLLLFMFLIVYQTFHFFWCFNWFLKGGGVSKVNEGGGGKGSGSRFSSLLSNFVSLGAKLAKRKNECLDEYSLWSS
jgi:hypothetical protein